MAGQSIPIIVGVGDFKNPFTTPEKALEPYQLMIQAIQRALQDTYLPEETSQQLQKSIDSIDVVATWSWPYQDLPGLLSTKLGVDAAHKFISDHGGNQPAKLVDEAARRIAQNKTKVAVVTGGEALASCMHSPSGHLHFANNAQWEASQLPERCPSGQHARKTRNQARSPKSQPWETVSPSRCCPRRGS